MDEIKQLIHTEIDPNFRDKKKEAKQQRGFIPSHIKILNHIAKNTVEVYELETGADYIMDFLELLRIVRVMGFTDKQVDMAISKLINGFYTIIDFDNTEIMFYDKTVKYNPIGQFISEGKEINDVSNYEEEGYNTQEFAEWYKHINRI